MVISSFGFLGIPEAGDRTIEISGLADRNLGQRVDKLKLIGVVGPIEFVGSTTDSVAFATFHRVALVIENLFEGSLVNDSLVLLEAGSLGWLHCLESHTAELKALDGLPGLGIKIEAPNGLEASVFEGFEEEILAVGSGNAAAPEVWVVLEFLRDVCIAYDIGNDSATARPENAKDFAEELLAS